MEKIDLKNIFLQVKEKSYENTKPRLTKVLEFIKEIIMKASGEGLYSKQLKFDSTWYSDITNQKLLRDLLLQEGIHINFNPIDPLKGITEVKVSWDIPVDNYKLEKFKKAEQRYIRKMNPNIEKEEREERERLQREREEKERLEKERIEKEKEEKKRLKREEKERLKREKEKEREKEREKSRQKKNGKKERVRKGEEYDDEQEEYRRYRQEREQYGVNNQYSNGWDDSNGNYKKVEKIKRVENIERISSNNNNHNDYQDDGAIHIPRIINNVTSKWLTDAFRLNGIIGNSDSVEIENIEEVEKRRCFEEGLKTYQIDLRYDSYQDNRSQAPSSIMLMLPDNDIDSKNRHNLGLYATSHIVHVEVVPRLDYIVKRQISHCYFTGANADTKCYVWILENCWNERPGGYVPSLFEGMKAEEGLEAIKFLANFHSHWWNNQNALSSFQDMLFNKKIFLSVIYDKFVEQSSKIEEYFTNIFKIKLLPQFLETIDFVKELFWSIIDFTEKFLPYSVIHGDFSPDDCYFYSNYQGNLNLVVNDWQQCCVFFVGYDLAVFLSRCLSLNTRKKHQNQFLQIYLDEIMQSTEQSKTRNLNMNILESSVKTGLAIYLVRVIVSIMGSPLEKDEDIIVMKKIFSRLQATILANDVLDFLQSIDLDADIQPPDFLGN